MHEVLELLIVGWTIFVTIFFMVCAWRAMRAHEEIANTSGETFKQWVIKQKRQ